MTDEPVFYTHPRSRGRTGRRRLEEIGQPRRTEIVEYRPPMKISGYLAAHPVGRVPAVRREEVVVTETAAICGRRRAAGAGPFPRSLSDTPQTLKEAAWPSVSRR